MSTPPGHRCPISLSCGVQTPRTICPGVVDRKLVAIARARAIVESLLDDHITFGRQHTDHASYAALVDAAFMRDSAVAGKAVAAIVRLVSERHQDELWGR